MSEIILKDYQIQHFNKIKNIFEKNSVAFDFSMLGTGKTFIGMKLFKDMGFEKLFLIAPVSVCSKWKQLCEKFNIELINNSYAKIRQPKSKYLTLIENNYIPTTELLSMLKNNKTLLVVDEFQHLKNKTNQNKSVTTLIGAFQDSGNKILLLSGSPFDKVSHAENVFALINVLKNHLTVFNPYTFCFEPKGMQEIINFCSKIDPYSTSLLTPSEHLLKVVSKKKLQENVFELFNKIVKKHLSSAMLPVKSDNKINKKNGYFVIKDVNLVKLLSHELSELECIFIREDLEGNKGLEAIKKINVCLKNIEYCKLQTFYRLAKEELSNSKDNKICLVVNYNASIDYLKELLCEYKPLVLNGSVPQNKRMDVISKFNSFDCDFRLLIANTSVISTGIDLDDKLGTFPRKVFISPNFNTIQQYQVAHRFLRSDTKSDTDLFMVYIKNHSEEKVLKALATKSGIMKQITEEQVENGVVFLSDYSTFTEDEENFKPVEVLNHDFVKMLENMNIKDTKNNLTKEGDYTIDQKCKICSLKITRGSMKKTLLKCGHFFHQSCIDNKFSFDLKCPCCRVDYE